MESIILKTLSNIFFCDTRRCFHGTKINNEFVSTLSVLSSENHIECPTQASSHVVGIQDCLTSGRLQSIRSKHLDVHPRDGEDCGGSEWSACNGSGFLRNAGVRTTDFARGINIKDVSWQIGCKMLSHTN
eukprot:Lithocolla_globosa_v1_NODE_863_length_3170_cov_7.332905.p2 type:complete len:130 gc:universal NODE_863_length_3170_cov_7.332905:2729-2340(-)